MKVVDDFSGISQVGNWLPGLVSVGPPLPVNEVLQVLALVPRIHDVFHFILLLAILHNGGGSRGRHRLARETVAIRLDVGDVYNRVDAHGVGKVEFNGIGPDQLHDGIGTEPSLQKLPGSPREAEIVG